MRPQSGGVLRNRSNGFRLLRWIVTVSVVLVGSRSRESSCCVADSIAASSYDWEDWDYYQILGFNETSISKELSAKDIKQAYRRQARRWHPDKQQQHHFNVSLSNSALSTEEANARFAKIAEAYQVLSDDDRRIEYERYRRGHVRQSPNLRKGPNSDAAASSSYNSHEASWSFGWKDFRVDPVQLFQDLFQDWNVAFDDEDENLFGGFERFNPNSSGEGHNGLGRPTRISHDEHILMDSWGREILRVLQTEEYRQIDHLYIRVMAQDFVETWDPYLHGFSYQPLQGEPFLMEEVHRPLPQTTSTMPSHEPLTTQSEWLEHGRYRAGLDAFCNLQIVDSSRGVIIWEIETEIPSWYSACQLELRGPTLVLVMGDYYHQEQIIWQSEILNHSHKELIGALHIARLDGDGALAVYQLLEIKESDKHIWLDGLLNAGSKTGAALVWQRFVKAFYAVEEMKIDQFSAEKRYRQKDQTEIFRRVCVWTSNPFGCLRVGRAFVHAFRDCILLGRRVIRVVDRLFDLF
jgi:curved DNA-binding protein CbpA